MTKRKSGLNTSNQATSTATAVTSRASAGAFFRYTPLSALFRSEYNVRKTGPLVDVPELADLIAAQDVLQNLVVYDELDAEGNPTGRSGVVGGGRRHAALLLNVERGLHGLDKLVPTLVTDEARAVEYSLAENRHAPMHPADEYDAFKTMADNGLSIEEIGARFGVEPIIVKRRLKLANVAPEFITMYRKEAMELDHLMELARVDSHDEQRRIWKSLNKYQRDSIYWLRNAINEGKLSLTDKKVKFVGVKAYEAAGGLVFRDIFADDEQGAIADPILLNTLVNEKLENKRDALKEAEGWAYVEIVDSIDYSIEKSYHETFKVERAPTEQESRELAKLIAKAEALREKIAQAEDAGDEKRARKLTSQLETVDESETAIRESLVVEDAEQREVAGAIIAVGDNGKLKVLRNMLKMSDYTRFRRVADRAVAKANGAGGQGADSAKPVVRAYSESLVRRLTAHRTLALQVEVARRPDIALAAMVATMVEQHYGNGMSGPAQVRVTEAALNHHMGILPAPFSYGMDDDDEAVEAGDAAAVTKSPAEQARDELHQEIDALLADAGDDVFAFLLTRPQDELLRLQAFFFSLSIQAVRSREEQEDTAAPLAKAVGLNMAKWWTPTAESMLSSISKAQLLSIVSEQGAVADVPQLSKLKVRELVIDVEARLSGQSWLPAVLRAA